MEENIYSQKMQPLIGLVQHQDIAQPFMLHNSIVRGRMVRLDNALNQILNSHQYPQAVAMQLAELLLLAAMLSTQLPEEGLLTLQIKGDLAVSFMVCDVEHNGGVRGYANITDQAAAAALPANANMQQVLGGGGYFAITLHNPYGEPYQGIVPLEGNSISEVVSNYFNQSQQLDVLFHNHIAQMGERYIASGIMLERMPELASDINSGDDSELRDDTNWDYHKLLIMTASKQELSDLYLAPSALLYRIFNEGGVWVYDAHKISKHCRCSRQKITGVLATMPLSELEYMQVDGIISVVCQFCNNEEIFTLPQILP